MINEKFKLDLPFPSVFPKSWKKDLSNVNFVSFRNLDHFRHTVSKITQKNDNQCDISYTKALTRLLKGVSDFLGDEQISIRNLVRSNLHKRGLITEEVYENYKYSVDGTTVGVDVGKYANGEPDCVITPSHQYIDFFYELYINISYPYTVKDSSVRKNIAKLLATIEELERQHIFIKITLILPIENLSISNSKNFFSAIPLFSHKETKSVNIMSSVINAYLLRKFYFAILEDLYDKDLRSSYGTAINLEKSMNVGMTFNEIDFFKNVVELVGA